MTRKYIGTAAEILAWKSGGGGGLLSKTASGLDNTAFNRLG